MSTRNAHNLDQEKPGSPNIQALLPWLQRELVRFRNKFTEKGARMKTITEIRLVLHGHGPSCRQRKHGRASGSETDPGPVSILAQR